MNKRRLTFKRVFNNRFYRVEEPKISICFDSYANGEEPNMLIIEREEDEIFENGMYITRMKNEHQYLVGEIANRLYEYEQLRYSPEELKEIIDDRKKLKERLNSLYGTATFTKPFAETRSDAWANTGVNIAEVMEKLRKQCANDTISLKAKIATLDEINKNKSNIQIQYVDYCKADVENTLEAYGRIHRMSGPYPWGWNIPEIDNVIFNDPATIIFWADGTKTVVKAEGEDFDPEKGLAMAISKKALGNKGNYFDIFKKWAGRLQKDCSDIRARKKQEEHEPICLAKQRLHNALHDKKATKADLLAAMQDAITYLNKKEN